MKLVPSSNIKSKQHEVKSCVSRHDNNATISNGFYHYLNQGALLDSDSDSTIKNDDFSESGIGPVVKKESSRSSNLEATMCYEEPSASDLEFIDDESHFSDTITICDNDDVEDGTPNNVDKDNNDTIPSSTPSWPSLSTPSASWIDAAENVHVLPSYEPVQQRPLPGQKASSKIYGPTTPAFSSDPPILPTNAPILTTAANPQPPPVTPTWTPATEVGLLKAVLLRQLYPHYGGLTWEVTFDKLKSGDMLPKGATKESCESHVWTLLWREARTHTIDLIVKRDLLAISTPPPQYGRLIEQPRIATQQAPTQRTEATQKRKYDAIGPQSRSSSNTRRTSVSKYDTAPRGEVTSRRTTTTRPQSSPTRPSSRTNRGMISIHGGWNDVAKPKRAKHSIRRTQSFTMSQYLRDVQ